MVALSTWYEGFARGLVSLHTPPLLGRTSRPLSPMIPTLARRSRKSNYSRTYRPPPGGRVWSYQVSFSSQPVRRGGRPPDDARHNQETASPAADRRPPEAG